MLDSPAAAHDGRSRSLLAIALLILAGAALLIRITAIAQPLGIDQSLWASAVRGMDRGQLLYRDVWEQRPPGIYWAYLWAFRLFGWSASTVAWLDVLAAAITTALVYGIARALDRRTTAALAAALYATMTMPAWMYGYGGFLERAVSETFIVMCVSGAAWAAARWVNRPSAHLALLMGLLAGSVLIFKPNAGLYFPALLFWMLLYGSRGPDRPSLVDTRTIVTASAGAAVIPIVALVWLWKLELLEDAATAVIHFNRYYVGEGFSPGAYVVAFSKTVWLRIKTDPLWLAGTVSAGTAIWTLVRDRKLPPLAGLAVIWGAAGICVIAVNGARMYNSYFIQVLPPLALLGGWGLASGLNRTSATRLARVATAGLMLMLLVQRDYAGRVFASAKVDLDVLTGRVDRTTYLERFGGYGNGRGYSARANTELADYLRTHTGPDDRIFLFGINGAGVYFEADRLTAHRFLRVNFFVRTDFPDPAFRLDAVVRALESSPPAYVVFERLHVSGDPEMARLVDSLPQNPEVARLLRRYRLETRIEDFSVYRRAD